MFNKNFFEQKSPQQRFLFILGVFMILTFITLGVFVVFFSDKLSIDPEKFPLTWRIAFAVVLVIYAGIRFSRLMNKKDDEI